MKKIVIALTGVIASGKSAALELFEKHGAFILSADAVAHEILKREGADKKALAAQIFNDPAARKQLEARLHPLIKKTIFARIKKAKQKIVVVEVPLLFETGWDKDFDITIALNVDKKAQAARAGAKTFFKQRAAAQLSNEQKVYAADIVIDNNSNLKNLETQINDLMQNLGEIW